MKKQTLAILAALLMISAPTLALTNPNTQVSPISHPHPASDEPCAGC